MGTNPGSTFRLFARCEVELSLLLLVANDQAELSIIISRQA